MTRPRTATGRRTSAVAVAGLVFACAASASPSALAAEPQACFDAALRGQKLQREGKLIAARDAFIGCAQASCPETVSKQCTAWVVDVNAEIPSIIFDARDDQGRDLTDVSVTIDGLPQALVREGREVPLDPGSHALRWRRSKGAVMDTNVVLREREKGRHLAVTFPSPSPVRRGPPLGAYVLAGSGVVALGIFGYFGAKGVSDRQSFGCDTSCASSDGSQVRREFIAADVALGVAVVSLAGALWLYLRPQHDKEEPPRALWSPSGAVIAF